MAFDKHNANQTETGHAPSLGDRDTLARERVPLGRVDQYELVRELGGGGFGVVYLARDMVAGVDVAVKGLPPLVRNNADELERIRDNFGLVSKLHHPNIAAALHLHAAREVSYAEEKTRQALRVLPGDYLMVMAFAPGVTLAKWRKQFPEGKVPAGQALEVCRQVAAALDYAHREKVAHRDVKPSNVMVETRGRGRGDPEVHGSTAEGMTNAERPTPNAEVVARVLDFGLAAEIRSSMSRVSQQKGDTSGTRPYMAPEQWAGRKQDGRTDQYALAALFCELVSGAVPFASAFDTGDPVIMERAVLGQTLEPLEELSRTQNAALLRGLAKEPAERFPSCVACVDALAGSCAETRRRGGKRAVFGLVGAAALVAVSVLSFRSVQSRNARLASERAAAEQTAALNAAQQAKVAGLKAAAEAALASGELEDAGARIAELRSAGGPASSLAELQKKYESKAGEREANKRYAVASVAREKAQALERGQGFGARLDALEVAWREAEAARQSGGWGQAVSGYDAVLATCKTLGELQDARCGAEARRVDAEQAKGAAETAEAARYAKDDFATGGKASAQAAEAFGKGEFDAAAKAWQEAASAFAEAKTRALVPAGASRKAQEAYEAALAKEDRALLEKYGGASWQALRRRVDTASFERHDVRQRLYQEALAALPGAVAEAVRARQAELERDQRSAAERARLEKARAGLEREMAAAKAAWDTADYGAAYAAYKRAVALCPEDAAARSGYARADALLSRLNPIRTAKKGDWWKTRSSYQSERSNYRSVSETRVVEIANGIAVTHVSSTTSYLPPEKTSSTESTTEWRHKVDEPDLNVRADYKYLKYTRSGVDKTEGMNKVVRKPKVLNPRFAGSETITVGAQRYACKCVVTTDEEPVGSSRVVNETTRWYSEEAPVPLLKTVRKSKWYKQADNKLERESEFITRCVGFEEESLVVGGRRLRCLKVTQTTGEQAAEQRRSTFWKSLDYPWLGSVKSQSSDRAGKSGYERVSEVEAFGSGAATP